MTRTDIKINLLKMKSENTPEVYEGLKYMLNSSSKYMQMKYASKINEAIRVLIQKDKKILSSLLLKDKDLRFFEKMLRRGINLNEVWENWKNDNGIWHERGRIMKTLYKQLKEYELNHLAKMRELIKAIDKFKLPKGFELYKGELYMFVTETSDTMPWGYHELSPRKWYIRLDREELLEKIMR